MSIYYTLKLEANAPETEIWIGDLEGHFVAKGEGYMEERLMPGEYVVTFGKLRGKDKGMGRPINLNRDRLVRESDG